MFHRFGFFISAALFYLPLGSSLAVAEDVPTDKKGTFSIQEENDLFGGGTDRHYTHGTRLSWVSPEGKVPEKILAWASMVPFFDPAGEKRYTLAFGQNMYTPSDITQGDVQKDDRPWAGWTYGSVGLVSDNSAYLDRLELTLGMVGPLSLADKTQAWVHKNISDSPDPAGWTHQLENEPGIILTLERTWRYMLKEDLPFGFQMDVAPHLGGSVGNIYTYANLGAMMRIGSDLPSDYGPPRIRPSLPGSGFFSQTEDVSWYVFGGIDGRAVLHNIFLDGNSFDNSHAVDKKPFVGDIQAGIVFSFGRYRLSYTKILRSEEFEKQQSPDEFGSLNLSVRF